MTGNSALFSFMRTITATTLFIFSASFAHGQTPIETKPFTRTPTLTLYDAETFARVNNLPLPSPVPSIYPRDISARFTEVIAGVPIIENSQSCEKDDLNIGVTVNNIAKSKGTIVADLHDDKKENFLVWDKVVLRVRSLATKGTVSFCMPLTQPGEYAVAVYHDKNGNKEFDSNFLGIPKEHFGMSNNPKFGLKSPKYEQAVFTVPAEGTNIIIQLRKSSDILSGKN